jgi:hypothetical protein
LRGADVVRPAGLQGGDPPPALAHDILDQPRDDPPRQLVDAARQLEPRMATVDLVQQFGEERHRGHLLGGEQAARSPSSRSCAL